MSFLTKNCVISIYVIFSLLTIGFMGILFFEGFLKIENVEAEIIIVDKKGSGNFTKIQDAINDANTGDTIIVNPGVYYESLKISKNITLIGNGSTDTIIDGRGAMIVVEISADSVMFSGFSVINSSGSTWIANGTGIKLNQVKYVKITNNHVTNKCFRSLDLRNSHYNILENNSIYGGSNGFDLVNSDRNTFKNNSIDGSGYGFQIKSSNHNFITNNSLINYNKGVYSDASHSNSIANNTFFNTTGAMDFRQSNYNNITNNRISNLTQSLSFFQSNYNKISQNSINKTYYGISFLMSDNGIIARNSIDSISASIRLDQSDSNSLINNSIQSIIQGISLKHGTSNEILGNNMTGCGIYFEGSTDNSYWNAITIDSKNIVNNKPVIFWRNKNSGTVPAGAGQIILALCDNIVVEKQKLDNGTNGIYLYSSPNTKINNNSCTFNSEYGIYIYNSKTCYIVDNNLSNNNEGIMIYSSDNMYIERNTCNNNKNRLYSSLDGIGINIHDSNNARLKNNYCSMNDCGISIKESISATIKNNQITKNNIYGYRSYRGSTHKLLSNHISNNSNIGISIDGTGKCEIENNYCSFNNRTGMFIRSHLNNIINNNFSDSSDYGMQLSVKNSLISNNICNNNQKFGLYMILKSDENRIEANTFSNADIGVKLSDSIRNLFEYNTIMNNNLGIDIDSDSHSCRIWHNNLINNTQQVSSGTPAVWYYAQEGNHWSDYIGVDNGSNGRTKGDGIGDTNIPHLSRDQYPFISANGWILPATPILNEINELIVDGSYTLTWNPTHKTNGYILEEDATNTFKSATVIYTGENTNYDIASKSDGRYFYRVRSYNVDYKGDWSNAVEVTTDSRPESPLGLVVLDPTGNSIKLKWSLNVENDIVFYRIYKNSTVSRSTGTFEIIGNVSNITNEYIVKDLYEEITYYFYITAVDKSSTESMSSKIISGTTLDVTPPQAPSGITAVSKNNFKISLTWHTVNDYDIEGYHIFMNDSNNNEDGSFHIVGTVGSEDTTFTMSGLSEQVLYHFKLTAFDEVPNNSSFSETISILTIDIIPPSIPRGLKLTDITPNSLTLTWDANPENDIIGYYVYKSLSVSSVFELLNENPITELYYIDKLLDEKRTYFYRLKAEDDFGLTSEFSEIVSAKTTITQYSPEINNTILKLEIIEDTYTDDLLDLYYVFKDDNDDQLQFSCEGQNNINVTILTNGVVAFKPVDNWNGKEELTFTASDGMSNASLTIEVLVLFVNDPPGPVSIQSPQDGAVVSKDEELDFIGFCEDQDLPYGDVLTFEWSSDLFGVIGDGQNLTNIKLTPGKHIITLLVTDSNNTKSSAYVKITVLKGSEQVEQKDDQTYVIITVIFICIIMLIILLLFRNRRKRISVSEQKSNKSTDPTKPLDNGWQD